MGSRGGDRSARALPRGGFRDRFRHELGRTRRAGGGFPRRRPVHGPNAGRRLAAFRPRLAALSRSGNLFTRGGRRRPRPAGIGWSCTRLANHTNRHLPLSQSCLQRTPVALCGSREPRNSLWIMGGFSEGELPLQRKHVV
ncbi:hypothetical protein SKAU_G00047430 [Synaphobranchus kaupii]|uniref:Uncharacterized protein n=1 Tax=Synaphobranchus kaupii TaxID=118154 RepID=A0A9Q1J935_SYNKA|nr:hypothetical protein SKAU_G00047430 [Synaphobranchus kaupii]